MGESASDERKGPAHPHPSHSNDTYHFTLQAAGMNKSPYTEIA